MTSIASRIGIATIAPEPRLQRTRRALGVVNQFGLPQHFLYFLPDPHGHGSFGPTFG